MFGRTISKPSIESLTKGGTDIHGAGRFEDVLSFNHFTEDDLHLLQVIGNKTYKKEEQQIIDLFLTVLQQTCPNKNTIIDKTIVKAYYDDFFSQKREEKYFRKIYKFFHTLRREKFCISKLVTVFNQVHFYIQSDILASSDYPQKRRSSFLESLHKGFNMEQEISVSAFTEDLLEGATDGIAALLEKNAEIVFIKDLVKHLDQQNADIQTVSSAAEELASSIEETATSASNISEQTKESVDKSIEGQRIISKALDEIIQTGETFEQIVSRFEKLQGFITAIENVVTLINGIADQTNLLALNASIEAARAGEHGKGFSVVASEVRKLAEHTVESLQEVNENVRSLDSFSKNVSELIHSTSNIISHATSEAKNSLPLLEDIRNSIIQIDGGTSEIAAVVEQQAASIDEVSQKMVGVAALTEEVRSLGEETSKVIFELSQSINSFRMEIVDNQDIHLSTNILLNLSKSDHILWKWRIYNMFVGQENLTEEDVSSHHDCRLGKWYSDPYVQKKLAGEELFRRLEEPHKMVHEYARMAVKEFKEGNIAKAEEALQILNKASSEVVGCINELITKIDD